MALPKSKHPGPPRGQPRIPPKLDLCRGCRRFVFPNTAVCPFCGAAAAALAADYAEKMRAAYKAAYELERLLRKQRGE